jgi:DNA-binding response OmpR family regulator
MMPLTDGWTVLEKLKGDGVTADIPVIILSVKGSQEVMRCTRDMGANHYMAKPFDPKSLISKVIEIIGTP